MKADEAMPEDAMPGGARDASRHDALRRAAIVWLTRLQSGRDPDCHQAFEDWYSADPRHADVFDSVQANWDRMVLAKNTPAAMRAPAPARDGWSVQRRLPAAIAAGLAALLLVGVSIRHFADPAGPDASHQDLVSRADEIRRVALADGTRVTLDTASALAVDFSGKERRVVMSRGRARFEVAHDPLRLFVVEAGTRLVIAHGTIFDVDLRAGTMEVSLLRGSVEVRRQVAHHEAQPRTGRMPETGQMLLPGQRLSLAERPGIAPALPTAFGAADKDWPTGMLSFTDRPVSEIVEIANRSAEQHILVTDPKLGAMRVTVTVPARDSSGLANWLADSLHLTLSRDPQGNFLLSRPIPKK